MVSCAGWICWMFVRSLRQECFHHVKNRRIFYQTVKTGLSRTMTAADRLWYLLKETSVCKWTHSADGPNRHHQKVQKVSRLIRIDRINIRKVLTSSETKKTRRSCCDCLALQNNSECFGQIMTSCKKWLKFQTNEHLQVCLWFFPCFPFCIFGKTTGSVHQHQQTSTAYTQNRQHATVLGTPSMPDDAGKVPLEQTVGQFAWQLHSVPVLCLLMFVFYFEAEREWSLEWSFCAFSEWPSLQPEGVSFLILLNSVWSMSRDMPWWQELMRVQCVERVHHAFNMTVHNRPQ